jgi:hypothetical protein
LRAVRSVFNDEKKLSIAAFSDAIAQLGENYLERATASPRPAFLRSLFATNGTGPLNYS